MNIITRTNRVGRTIDLVDTHVTREQMSEAEHKLRDLRRAWDEAKSAKGAHSSELIISRNNFKVLQQPTNLEREMEIQAEITRLQGQIQELKVELAALAPDTVTLQRAWADHKALVAKKADLDFAVTTTRQAYREQQVLVQAMQNRVVASGMRD